MSGTRARWITGIQDLYSDLDLAQNYLTVAQVSEKTGFATTTITDLLSRRPITSASSPLGALSRPARRIGVNPLYSHEQVAECLKRREASGDRLLGGVWTPLPTVSPAEARERDLVTTVEIADLAGVHEQTVRKWAGRYANFPAPTALRRRGEDDHPGVPFVVRPRAAVERWVKDLRANGLQDDPIAV